MDNIVKHYGIKGMRWGVRKKRETGGSRKRKLTAEERRAKAKRIERLAKIGLAAFTAYKVLSLGWNAGDTARYARAQVGGVKYKTRAAARRGAIKTAQAVSRRAEKARQNRRAAEEAVYRTHEAIDYIDGYFKK